MPTTPTGMNCRHDKEVPNQIEMAGVKSEMLAVAGRIAS